MSGRNDLGRSWSGRTRRLVACVLPLLVLSLAGCKPSERVTQEFELGLSNVTLTNSAPLHAVRASLKDDPYYAEHEEDLDSVSDLGLRIAVSRNTSSRLRLGVYVSREQETRLVETTKIADFNLLPGQTTVDGTDVRMFNELTVRSLVLNDEFFIYVAGEADRIDVTVSQLTLVVTAKFIE